VKRIGPADVVRILALALVYVLAARLGLMLDAVAGFATMVWPPSGIALAAILLVGFDVWPGIAIGALLANLLTGAPPFAAIGIAVGNTLEAVLAARILLRIPEFRRSLERVSDVFALIGAALVSPLVSATVGVASLYLGGILGTTQILEAWSAWWIGDFVGILLVASLILVWATPRPTPSRLARWPEAAALGVVVIVAVIITYLRRTNAVPGLIFPVLIWSALRFGARGAVTTSFVASGVAIWGASLGVGPFVRAQLRDSLLALQTFTTIMTGTFLVLAAAIEERRAAEREARAARVAAEQANAAKAEFLAVMSHELRTPLNAISGYVDILKTGLHGPLNEKQQESLGRMQRNQQHLLGLINDVLSFARVEAGHLQLKPTTLPIGQAIDAVESLILPELQRKAIVLTRQTFDETLSACADPEKLQQVLLNLLSNAAKFTDNGGRIAIGAEVMKGQVRIWVRDSGIGIPKEQLSRVFEAFFQVDRGTTRIYPGIGLGLTIARDLARAMHGEVTLESEVGAGTTASVILPAA
jgi:signal transduction histidine kinase